MIPFKNLVARGYPALPCVDRTGKGGESASKPARCLQLDAGDLDHKFLRTPVYGYRTFKRPLLAVSWPVSCSPLSFMDSLIAKADAIRPLSKKRKTDNPHSRPKPGPSKKTTTDDPTAASVSQHTALPRSLRPSSPPPEETKKYSHIHNKKLRTELSRQSAQNARSKRLVKDAELLLTEEAGLMEVEGELEKTWRVGQDEIASAAGQQAAQGRQEWRLDGGPYRVRYTRNGRSVLFYLMAFSLSNR